MCLCIRTFQALVVILFSLIPSIIPMFHLCVHNPLLSLRIKLIFLLAIMWFVTLILIWAMRVIWLVWLVGMLMIIYPWVTLDGMNPELILIVFAWETCLGNSCGLYFVILPMIVLWPLLSLRGCLLSLMWFWLLPTRLYFLYCGPTNLISPYVLWRHLVRWVVS